MAKWNFKTNMSNFLVSNVRVAGLAPLGVGILQINGWTTSVHTDTSNTEMPCSPSYTIPDSKGYGANMGRTWGRQDPGEPYVGLRNLAIWVAPL